MNRIEHEKYRKVLIQNNADLLLTIKSRKRFYLWYHFNVVKPNQLKIRWPLTAFVIATGIDAFAKMDYVFGNNRIQKFFYTGNQIIFDDVLKKLNFSSKLMENLKDDERALAWDTQTLWEEQNLIQGLYKELSADDVSMLRKIIKLTQIVIGKNDLHSQNFELHDKFIIETTDLINQNVEELNLNSKLPKFENSDDLLDVESRCNYGFKVMRTIFNNFDSKFMVPYHLDECYINNLNKSNQTISCPCLIFFRKKDNIHALNSLLDDNYLQSVVFIKEILKNILKEYVEQKNRKESFILNYDFKIISKLAEIDSFIKTEEERLFFIIHGILNQNTKLLYEELMKTIYPFND